jgi:FAD/FMN-containing dehydrogenase
MMSDHAQPFISKPISGWGRYPIETCRVYRPEKTRTLKTLVAGQAEPTWIARGLGRSYGDPAMNAQGGVIDMTRMNRMLAWDAERGLLRCEAGVSLADVVGVFLPRGWFLGVTPGTKFVTVGGAIANDVHGKNHHCDGSFGQWVAELDLLTPTGEVLTCSPDQNADVFWATVGGVGLTGFILTATLRLVPMPTPFVRVDYARTRDMEEALALMAETDRDYKYSVAWIDCLARGKSLGRSVLMSGNPASRVEVESQGAREPRKFHVKVPFDFPGFAINKLTVAAFNATYYKMNPTVRGKLVHYDPFFYPLDSVDDWNRMYGKRGFVQYQVTLPQESLSGMILLLERLSASGRVSFLSVLKCMGEGNPGLLSYPSRGYTLALDLPYKAGIVEFLNDLDRIVLDHGGRFYLAKDSTTTPQTVATIYPRLEEFRAIQRRLDPQGRLRSSMSRRLGLADGAGDDAKGDAA